MEGLDDVTTDYIVVVAWKDPEDPKLIGVGVEGLGIGNDLAGWSISQLADQPTDQLNISVSQLMINIK